MKAVILVAGRGSRLKPFTDKTHKCLTEINGKAILINALENLSKNGIEETILVIGYLGNQIKEKIGDSFEGMKISYVENLVYEKTSTSYSLWLALKNLDSENILILEGDVFFEETLLKDFLNNANPNLTVVEKYKPSLDGSFVDLKENQVMDWIHKSKRKDNFKIEDKFKTANIHKFDGSFLESVLKPVLRKHVEVSSGKNPLEYVMQDIVKDRKEKIYAFKVGSLRWFEIDDVKDLRVAEKIFEKKPSLDEVRSRHGGYWRSNHIDFHYLFNHYFPTKKFYQELAEEIPRIGNHYPSSQKILAKLLAKWKDESFFTAENLVVGNGSSELIRLLNNHVITKATVPLPTFNEFARVKEKKAHKYLLSEEEKFKLNVDKLIKEIKKSNSEFAVIINPNNPVGNLTSLKDIEKVLETGVTLIIDEAFMSFAGQKYSAEQLVPKYKNLVIVSSCTKSIGIAGLRLGYILTSNEEIKEKLRFNIPIWNINSITEYLIEIFPKYKKEHEESLRKSREDTKWFFESLKDIPFLEPFPTYANAVFCKVEGSARRLAEILYEKYNLMVKEGLNQKEFKTDAYIRLGVRNREDNKKLLQALKEIKRQDLILVKS